MSGLGHSRLEGMTDRETGDHDAISRRSSSRLIGLALPCLGDGGRRGRVAADFPRFEAQEIDPHAGEIVYAVTVADVNGNKKPDVVAVTEDAVVWYENPGWARHDIIRKATARDNVCIQPHDIDGDGRIDFALGPAGVRPTRRTPARSSGWAATPRADGRSTRSTTTSRRCTASAGGP